MGRWENKYVIGLTGNIAVGKSVVRQMLQHLGAYTIDADGLVHMAMAPGAPAYKPIVDTFGQFILNPDKTINRSMLASIVFSNPAALKQLEAVTHPIVGQAINTLVSRAKQQVVVIEAIKLLEGELANAVDTVWVVNAKPQTQYNRLVSKRKMSAEDAKQRILAQNQQADKLKAAKVVIQNDDNIELTWKQVQAAWKQVMQAIQPPPPKPAPPPAPAPREETPARQTPSSSPMQPPAQQVTPVPAAPAQPSSQPASVVGDSDDDISILQFDISGIKVKRGMPSNSEAVAEFINRMANKSISRMDVIMTFGQKSYLLAENESGKTVGLIGWQVENLITRADELYLDAGSQATKVIYALIQSIEEASKELQSEVSFVFLPPETENAVLQPFFEAGYEVTTIKEIKIPAWREAVQELGAGGMQILTKRLRKDRVLKPI